MTSRGDSYGSLVRGYIIPPVSGTYTFWVSGDDETEFWLSNSADPTQINRIASVPGWTTALDYTKYAAQRSPGMELSSDARYYFEIVHKEGGGGDHFSVAWEGPGFSRQLVSGQAIASYAGEPDAKKAPSVEEAYRLGYTVGFLDGSEALAFYPHYPPRDADQDGIYDNWEALYGLNPEDPSDATTDPDNDLLSPADEFLLGTAENNPDTDGDGIPDGAEFALSTDPLDSNDAQIDLDGDGATNLEEYLAGTDPQDQTSVPASQEIAPTTVFANGFVGQYFQGTNFDQFLIARNEPSIQFLTSSGGFASAQPSDNFSAKWYGQFTAPHSTGERSYTFKIRTDDGARLYINGNPAILAWRDQGATDYRTSVSINAQQTVKLMMEYYERGGAAVAELSVFDDSRSIELSTSEVMKAPDLATSSNTDSDGDGIPDTWELRYGLSPWVADGSNVQNSSGITNLDAFNAGLNPWSLEPVSYPESPTVDDSQTTEPVVNEPAGYSVTLNWTAPLTRVDGSSIALSEIQSYEILYGTSPDALTSSVTVNGSDTSASITGLKAGTWYFSMRVTDINGLTSENSEVLSHTVP